MAKKRAINKSEEIRNYKNKHPDEKPLAIAKALTAKTGVEFTASSVSTVLYQQKTKGGAGGKRRGAKTSRGRKAGATGASTSSVVAAIDAASNLIDAAGSIDAAKMILEKIGDTRSR